MLNNSFLHIPSVGVPTEKKIWDIQLAEYGEMLLNIRLDYITKFSNEISSAYHFICNNDENLKLKYDFSFKRNKQLSIKNDMLQQFEKIEKKEYAYQRTMIGPHLDDYIFYIEEKEARRFASQGQKRSIAIAAKFIQAKLISQTIHDKPIMVFDDVLVDLDKKRNNQIIDMLNKDHQVFIATPNKDMYNYINLPEINLEEILNETE